MSGYGQFCPVAKAMELLDERWTMLVIRELMLGSRHFSALQRGLPRMSPTLLSARLRTLARAGVVERHADGNRISYTLTPAGQELRPIVEALGPVGRAVDPELGDEDLDPHLLLWDIHRNVDRSAVPPGRTVLQFVFRDVPGAGAPLVAGDHGDEVDVCDADPGYPVTAAIETGLRTLTEIWLGNLELGRGHQDRRSRRAGLAVGTAGGAALAHAVLVRGGAPPGRRRRVIRSAPSRIGGQTVERHPALERLSPLVGEWSMQTSFGRSSGWTRRARTCSTTTTPAGSPGSTR